MKVLEAGQYTGPYWWAFLLVMMLFVIKSIIIIIPIQSIYIISGMLLPSALALLAAMAGLSLELTLNYLVGRLGKNTRLFRWIEAKASKSDKTRLREDNSAGMCLVLRLAPNPIPFDVRGMLLGAAGMPYRKYLFFSLMGISVTMIPMVLAGGAITNPLSARFLVPFLISLSLTLLAYLLYKRVLRRKSKRSDKDTLLTGRDPI